MRATFHTLGCRLNQTETAHLTSAFRRKGYAIVDWGEPADLVVVNTCSVTAGAESDCRNAVRQALRRAPEAFVVVVGCYAQVGLEALRRIPGVDLIVGTEYKMKFPALIDAPRKLPEPAVLHSRLIDDSDFEIEGSATYDTARANLKIQDGCDFFCSFCVIPFTRGRERSRRLPDVLREARELAARGHREVVLTGVNLGRYAWEDKGLVELVRELEAIDDLARIRISSIEPTTIDPRLVAHMAESEKLCPHLHVPLQSGDDDVLRGMNRRYGADEVRRFLEDAGRRMPDLGLGTDVIVGAPGETDEAFARTERLLDELPFAYFHVFSYSKRYGTRAAHMDGQVRGETTLARSKTLRDLSRRKRLAFARRYVGREVAVLFEQQENGLWTGHAANYLKVGVASKAPLARREASVRIEDATPEMALGRVRD